jgi:predicted AlkP superfamily pyrophosphatase or phosphodiesterase
MQRLSSALLSCLAVLSGFSAPAPATRPFPDVEHVVVISIDGLRPDRLLLADTPAIRQMIHEGTYTFWAKTTAVSITLPSHTSMVTGVIPRKHGIEWNRDLPLSEAVYPLVPTVMEMATKAGYDTAMVAGKSKFATLDRPGTITHVYVPKSGATTNADVAAHAADVINEFKPAFLFVHFPDVDVVGHAKGWGSTEQLTEIEKTDRAVGQVLGALDQAGIRASTVIILTADHGGAGLTHGADDPRSRHIPWIVTGPHVKRFFDLTQLAELEVRTEDTCATACWLLGLPQLKNFDGKPVTVAFEARGGLAP